MSQRCLILRWSHQGGALTILIADGSSSWSRHISPKKPAQGIQATAKRILLTWQSHKQNLKAVPKHIGTAVNGASTRHERASSLGVSWDIVQDVGLRLIEERVQTIGLLLKAFPLFISKAYSLGTTSNQDPPCTL